MEEDLRQNSPSNSTPCFNFSANDLTLNTVVTVSLHGTAIIACIVAIFFIIATRQHRIFVNRLILYLMVATSLWSLSIVAEVIPVTHRRHNIVVGAREGWEGTCATVGFVGQVIESAKILIVCWIVLYLLLLVVFKHNASKRRHEVAGVIVVVTVPLLADWIPFCWNWYGPSGLWCWIRLTDEKCQHLWKGLALMLAIEYVPVLLAITFTIVTFVSITVTFCRRARRTEIKWRWASVYQKGLAEAAALMAYPLVYSIIFLFRILHRTYYVVKITRSSPPDYRLWLAHSTALGIGGVLIPFLYILRPSNLKKLKVQLCRRLPCCCSFSSSSSSSSFSCGGVVYRSSSMGSTEALSEDGSTSGIFRTHDEMGINSIRDSSLLYKSILKN